MAFLNEYQQQDEDFLMEDLIEDMDMDFDDVDNAQSFDRDGDALMQFDDNDDDDDNVHIFNEDEDERTNVLDDDEATLSRYVEEIENQYLLKRVREHVQREETRKLKVSAQMQYYSFLPEQVRMGLELLLQHYSPWLEHDVVDVPRKENGPHQCYDYHWKLSGAYKGLFHIHIHVHVQVPLNSNNPMPPPTWIMETPCLPVPPYYYKEGQPLCSTMKPLKREVGWTGPQVLANHLASILLPELTMESYLLLYEKMPWLNQLYMHSPISWAMVGAHAHIYYEVRTTFSLFTPEDVEARVTYGGNPVTTQMVQSHQVNYEKDADWEILYMGRPRPRPIVPSQFYTYLKQADNMQEYLRRLNEFHQNITPALHDAGFLYKRIPMVLDEKRKLKPQEADAVKGLVIRSDLGAYKNVVEVYQRLCEILWVSRDTDNPIQLERADPRDYADVRYERHKGRVLLK